MGRFTELFQNSSPEPASPPAPAPTPEVKVVEAEKVVPITKASKKKGFTME